VELTRRSELISLPFGVKKMTDFQDISIVELNDIGSGLSNVGPLTSMVLRLSADAPDSWCAAFNEGWQSHAGMMKRKATANRDTITSLCMPYELQGQIIELNKVISQTNATYRASLSPEAAGCYREADARRELSDLKNSLTYE